MNLASMIDVTFLLLLYFLVTTVLAKPEDRLSPALQMQRDSTASSASDFEPQIVEVMRIDGEPGYRLGASVLRGKPALTTALRGLPKAPGLFINVHGDVDVAYAVAAVQAARDAGFEQVTYVPAD